MAGAFLPIISSCDNHTHVFDKLVVVDDKLYKSCECGEKVALTDEELAQYDNKFLIEDGGVLTPLETTSLSDIQILYPGKDSFDIYVTSGNFELKSQTNGNANFNFHGILNSEDKYNLHIQCGQVDWHIDKMLSFTNAYMHGGTTGELDKNGLHCIDLICKNCYFDGYQSIWASDKAQFTNCTFNPTNTDEYIFYTYGPTLEIDFSNCNFIARRKAIKVYRQIDVPMTINFKDSIFQDPTETANVKAAVEIDSSSCAALSEDCEWNIYMDKATMKTINTDKWDGICKNRPQTNDHVKFNNEIVQN